MRGQAHTRRSYPGALPAPCEQVRGSSCTSRRNANERRRPQRPRTERYGPDGEVVHEWTQRALAVSRVMQVWRDVIVRNRLLEDEASSPYLQRKHCVLKDTGYARAAAACAREPKGIPASVQEKMKEAFDNA